MSIFSGLFKKNKETNWVNPIKVDIHSHLLPGLDDGVESYEESLRIIMQFSQMGYRKLITTPHIMGDFYQNTNDEILSKLTILRKKVKDADLDIEIEAAAEYYLDDSIMDKIRKKNLLTFGDNYVLVETSYISENDFFDSMIFELKVHGYKPVLAHPERYIYLYSQKNRYQVWKEHGILFQLNINSLGGYYSKEAQKIAEMLVKEGMINFVGSDLHHAKHFIPLEKGLNTTTYQKLMEQELLNNSLLS